MTDDEIGTIVGLIVLLAILVLAPVWMGFLFKVWGWVESWNPYRIL